MSDEDRERIAKELVGSIAQFLLDENWIDTEDQADEFVQSPEALDFAQLTLTNIETHYGM